jgi:hypothetical protein
MRQCADLNQELVWRLMPCSKRKEMRMPFDMCPHCRKRLEIVCLKFRLYGTVMLSACPNCGIVIGDYGSESLVGYQRPIQLADAWKGAFNLMRALNTRFRRIVACVLAAVIVAALARHAAHVYGGIAPPDIRVGALIALIPAISFLLIFMGRRS